VRQIGWGKRGYFRLYFGGDLKPSGPMRRGGKPEKGEDIEIGKKRHKPGKQATPTSNVLGVL